jgi:hypothetical protein
MIMSSRYTTKKVLVNGLRISSIILMKVAGEIFKPKGMTNHSKRASFDFKVIFHTSVSSIWTWWKPDFRSILLKYVAPMS